MILKLICNTCNKTFYCLGNCGFKIGYIKGQKYVRCHCVKCTVTNNSNLHNSPYDLEKCPKFDSIEEAIAGDL